MKPIVTIQTPIAGPTRSWWLGLDRVGFQTQAAAEAARIKRGRFNTQLGSPVYGDEDGAAAMTKPGRKREGV